MATSKSSKRFNNGKYFENFNLGDFLKLIYFAIFSNFVITLLVYRIYFLNIFGKICGARITFQFTKFFEINENNIFKFFFSIKREKHRLFIHYSVVFLPQKYSNIFYIKWVGNCCYSHLINN